MRVSRKHHHCVLLYVGLTVSLFCIGCSPAEGQRLEADEVPTTSPEHGTLRAFQQQAVAEHAVERAKLVRQLAKEGRGTGQTKSASDDTVTGNAPPAVPKGQIDKADSQIIRVAKQKKITHTGWLNDVTGNMSVENRYKIQCTLKYSVRGNERTFINGYLILGRYSFYQGRGEQGEKMAELPFSQEQDVVECIKLLDELWSTPLDGDAQLQVKLTPSDPRDYMRYKKVDPIKIVKNEHGYHFRNPGVWQPPSFWDGQSWPGRWAVEPGWFKMDLFVFRETLARAAKAAKLDVPEVPADMKKEIPEPGEHPSKKDTKTESRKTSQTVEWSKAAEGNGHFYQAVAEQPGISWDQAQAAAEKAGGYLVTLTSRAENQFVFNLIDTPEYWNGSNALYGPWIGCVQAPGSSEPDGGWGWGNREGFNYSKWDAQQPNNRGSVDENRVIYGLQPYRTSAWCDVRRDLPEVKAYVIEYDTEPRGPANLTRNSSQRKEIIVAKPNTVDSKVIAVKDDGKEKDSVLEARKLLQTFPDFHRIQGDWILVGDKASSPQKDSQYHLTLNVGTMIIQRAGRNPKQYSYRISTVSTPHQFDIFAAESDVEPLFKAVYKFDGDRLILRIPPAKQPRPDHVTEPTIAKCKMLRLQRVSTMPQSLATADAKRKVLDDIVASLGGLSGRVDLPRAAGLILASAEAGDPRGKMWLSKCVFKGECGFTKNVELAQRLAGEAVDQVERLAKQGDHHAQLLWGIAIENRLGTNAIDEEARIRPDELQKGRFWYKASIKQGNVAAMFELGLNSEFSRQRPLEARKYYRAAIEHGHVLANDRIATHLLQGTECRQDRKKSLEMFNQSAAAGSTYAMSVAGEILFNNDDDSDNLRCFVSFQRAAEAGNPNAAFRLGLIHKNGSVGVDKNKSLGLAWIKRSASVGWQPARKYLSQKDESTVVVQRNDSPWGNRSSTALPMAALRNAVEGQPRRNSHSQGRFNGPGWNEDQRYEEYQQRKVRTEHWQRFNQNVSPGMQMIPRRSLGWGP